MSIFRRLITGAVLAFLLFAVAACGPATPLPSASATPTSAAAVPALLPLTPTPSGLVLVQASPPEGAALSLSGALTFTFSRPLDRSSARRAFRLLDAAQQAVAGRVDFPNERTLRFTPAQPLKPESAYTVVFATGLRAADGTTLEAPLRLAYTTEAAFTVLRVFPAEDSRDVPLNADITLVFNKPVVPLTNRESAAAAPLPLKVTPAVEGEGRWVSTAIYTFHPSRPLTSNTTYTVTLPAGLQTLNGETLTAPTTWSFHTHAAHVRRVRADNGTLDEHTPLTYARLDTALQITFSQPMERAATEQAVQVTAAQAPTPPLEARWNDDDTQLTLVPQGFYAPDATYTLTIAASARSQDGGTLSRAYRFAFHTAGLPRVLSTIPADGQAQKDFAPWAMVVFDTYPDPQRVAPYLRITPRPAKVQVNIHDRRLFIGGLEAGTTYTITLLPGLPDLFGHTLPQAYTFHITTAHLQPYAALLLPAEPAVVRADGPQTVWLRYANLNSATLSLYAVTSDMALMHALARGDACTPTGAPVGSWQPEAVASAAADAFHTLQFPLSALNGGQPLPPGIYCLTLHPQPAKRTTSDRTYWLLVTTDNLTLQTGPGDALVWATDLDHGAPQPALPVHLFTADTEDYPPRLSDAGIVGTDADGVASWPSLPHAARFAVVHTADRFAFVDAQWGAGNLQQPLAASYWDAAYTQPRDTIALIYTDRPLYRPGQEIFFKGLVRRNHDLHYSLPEATAVWVTFSHEGKTIHQQRLPLSAWGTFHGSVLLAKEAPPGTYSWAIRLSPKGALIGWGSVRVALYHKPVFEVRLTPHTPTLMPGGRTTVQLEATYYAGDAVGRAAVDYEVETHPYTFRPPKAWSGYTFQQTASWAWDFYFLGNAPPSQAAEQPPQSGKTTTDAQGRAEIPVEAPIALQSGDQQLTVWASVTDAGGNAADGHTTIVVRKSNVYVGLQTEGWMGTAGQPTTIHLVVLDADGRPLPNYPLTLKVEEERWHSVQQRDASGMLRWHDTLETTPVAAFTDLTTDAHGRAAVTFTPDHSGTYRFTAAARDHDGRRREASLRFWVAGKEALLWAQGKHTLPLIPDKSSYRPGETARLLAPQPFGTPTYALLTVARGHVFTHQVVRLDQPNTLLRVPLSAEMAPVVYASLVTLRPATADRPPDFRSGIVRLPVALDAQQLEVTLTPDRDHLAPSETVRFTVETRTTDGQPVPAEVSLALVDKAIYALAPDTFNLLERLYPLHGLSVATALGLVNDLEAYDARIRQWLPEGGGMGSGGGEKGADLGGVIPVRETFRDTAYWRADVQTDAQGRATVAIHLPDNMTTWVMRARAVTADTRVGTATAEITVNRPFFVRLHTPAFFTGGDQPRIQAVVHNATDAPLEATVRLTRAEGLTLESPAVQTVSVPARGQAVVTWQATVPFSSHRVDLAVEARSGDYRDATRPTLTTLPDGGIPVYQFTTTETVGTSGVLPQAAEVHEIVVPPANAADFTLRLDLAASLTAGLAQALAAEKPPKCGCTYAWAENLLTNAAAAQAFQALGATPADQKTLDAAIQRDVQALEATQHPNGGWGWCPQGDSAPLPTAYATFALAEAARAGYTVDEGTLHTAANYLYRASGQSNGAANPTLTPEARAFILDALARLPFRFPGGLTTAIYALAQESADRGMGLAGWALLLHAAQASGIGSAITTPIRNRLENAVALSASGAHWDSESGPGWLWHSDVATTALALDALLEADPRAPFLPQAVRWLMQARSAEGCWPAGQDTAIAVLALAHWVRFSGENRPNYRAAVAFDGQQVAAFTMTPTSDLAPQRFSWQAPALRAGTAHTLAIRRTAGPGVLYYSAFLETVLPASQAAARADGVAVSRAYYLLRDLDTPVTTVPVGALVQVRLTVVAPHDLRQVLLTDFLPAGLEALDPNRTWKPEATDAFSPEDFRRYGWGGWYFYHRQAYDERVVFSADTLPAGVYTVVYYARAAVPGRYQVRPATAGEVFFPDVSGRSSGEQLTIAP